MKISAKILAHSISPSGQEIITYEIVMAKVLIAEFNTHRMLSKNFSSSRAIPTKNIIEGDYFEPLFYGKNQPGMVALQESIDHVEQAATIWKAAVDYTRETSTKLSELGLHKQWANRCNDWHTMAKGVVTGTEWDNFFALRLHADAQPEMYELARLMDYTRLSSNPFELSPGEWHLPYINRVRSPKSGELFYTIGDFPPSSPEFSILSLEDAQKISMSCCAQVSYRRNDDSIEKAEKIYAMLNIGSATNPGHYSPLEHLATPMQVTDHKNYVNISTHPDSWERGITHSTRSKALWSANFHGFIQYRQVVV